MPLWRDFPRPPKSLADVPQSPTVTPDAVGHRVDGSACLLFSYWAQVGNHCTCDQRVQKERACITGGWGG